LVWPWLIRQLVSTAAIVHCRPIDLVIRYGRVAGYI